MEQDSDSKGSRLGKAGLAALVLLAPGGFILGFTLAARHYRKKREAEARSANAAGDPPQHGSHRRS